ncbi:MAG: GNAT family N-acetyltransferase [Candidatus Berkelbacteria bacterium]|nr:GNAT family N-acetyltransferase [Candidatus Berkelbacteria bacterium]MCR4307989.1 GNAT family N-acetyltransferase [Candidatus Berkelbacteria bacterium]
MNIIRMESRHLEEVIQIGLSEEDLHTRTDTPEFYGRETLERWIGSLNGVLLVAEDEKNTLAGFSITSYNPDSRDAYIHCIATRAEFRKKGVGGLMLEATLEELRQMGCNFVRCLIALDNETSAKLFVKYDFKLGDKFYYVARNL